jgi:hypothetical protein
MSATPVLAAIVALVVGCAPMVPTPAPPATSQPSAIQETPPTAGWEPVGPNLGECGVGAALLRASGELLAICQDNSLRPHVLTTRDGQTWQVVQPSGIVANDPNHLPLVRSLGEGPNGLVLVGAEALDDISSGDAAAWTSSDGVQWQRTPASQTLRDAEMTGVVAVNDGFLAVGADGFPGGNVQLPGLRAPAVWHSDDAKAWKRLAFARAADRMLFEGIAATPTGWVAWGGGPGPRTGAVWTSSDGADWKLAANQAGPRWGPIARIAAAPDGSLVAVGSKWGDAEDAMAGIWRSTDGGATWSGVDIEGASDLGALWDVVATTTGLLTTGAQGRVAFSSDGADWNVDTAARPRLEATLRLLVATPGFVIAFGSIESDNGTTWAIWRREAGSPT